MTKKNRKEHRSFSADKKMEILKSHLVHKKPISEVCEQYEIPPAMFYRWQANLFESGDQIFNSSRTIKSSAKEEDLESENKQLRQKLSTQNSVMLELMEEHVKLKKKLGVS